MKALPKYFFDYSNFVNSLGISFLVIEFFILFFSNLDSGISVSILVTLMFVYFSIFFYSYSFLYENKKIVKGEEKYIIYYMKSGAIYSVLANNKTILHNEHDVAICCSHNKTNYVDWYIMGEKQKTLDELIRADRKIKVKEIMKKQKLQQNIFNFT